MTRTWGPWSLGTKFAMPIGLTLALVAFLVALYFYRWWRAEHETSEYQSNMIPAGWLAIVALIASIGLLATVAGVMWPYRAEYHRYSYVSGTVSQVSSRFLAGDHATNQKFVVRFEGSSEPFGCNDTRCSLVKKGDHIRLACKKVWQYAATPGWDCNWKESP